RRRIEPGHLPERTIPIGGAHRVVVHRDSARRFLRVSTLTSGYHGVVHALTADLPTQLHQHATGTGVHVIHRRARVGRIGDHQLATIVPTPRLPERRDQLRQELKPVFLADHRAAESGVLGEVVPSDVGPRVHLMHQTVHDVTDTRAYLELPRCQHSRVLDTGHAVLARQPDRPVRHHILTGGVNAEVTQPDPLDDTVSERYTALHEYFVAERCQRVAASVWPPVTIGFQVERRHHRRTLHLVATEHRRLGAHIASPDRYLNPLGVNTRLAGRANTSTRPPRVRAAHRRQNRLPDRPHGTTTSVGSPISSSMSAHVACAPKTSDHDA